MLKATGAYNVGGETTSSLVEKVSIWEPNSNDHIDYIVTNNNKVTGYTNDTGENTVFPFTNTSKFFTYTLNKSAIGATVPNVYNWASANTYVTKTKTVQTTKTSTEDYRINEGVTNLKAVDGNDFSIKPNAISRVRVYLWMEGQDVDCINYASYGGGIEVNLGLTKGETEGYKKDGDSEQQIQETLFNQIDSSNFGDFVEYPVDLNGDRNLTNDWRIFYKNNAEGTNNVFLIAADYVDWSKNTLNTNAMKQDSNYAPYDVYWNAENLSYASRSLDSSKFLHGQMTQINKDNNNFKAISTLLNTTYWKSFVNEKYAISAIGSPTIEMFVNSWNAKFRGNSDYGVLSCKYDYSSDGSGYYLGTDGKADSNNLPVKGYNKSGAELYWSKKYTITSGSGVCYGYWIASPSAYSSGRVLRVIYSGSIDYCVYSYGNYFGVRPVVCLKSGITATKEGDVWKLYEK